MKWSKKENDVSGENFGIYIKKILTNYWLAFSIAVQSASFFTHDYLLKSILTMYRLYFSSRLVGEIFFALKIRAIMACLSALESEHFISILTK